VPGTLPLTKVWGRPSRLRGWVGSHGRARSRQSGTAATGGESVGFQGHTTTARMASVPSISQNHI
jgi:hypothetical protein